jgi:6-phosphogluconolactonase/glucosamine-6-phosphate isomerase/deaminase
MIKKFQVQKFNTPEEAIISCGNKLNLSLTENKKIPILLLLSGGSALKVLEEILPEALGEHITISMLDERFSENEKINNFCQMQKTGFYELALASGCNIIGTLPRPKESGANFCQRIETSLKAWQKNNPNGKIFATFGMGTEGHTAGIFPISNTTEFENLFQKENWLTYYSANTKYTERVTTTLSFFENIDYGFALVCGAEKQPAFKRLMQANEPINSLPALGWQKLKNLEVFTNIT